LNPTAGMTLPGPTAKGFQPPAPLSREWPSPCTLRQREPLCGRRSPCNPSGPYPAWSGEILLPSWSLFIPCVWMN